MAIILTILIEIIIIAFCISICIISSECERWEEENRKAKDEIQHKHKSV